MAESEVARLLESIRLSYEAASLALHGPAMLGRHEFITKKMEQMHYHHQKLQAVLGEEAANQLVAKTLDAIEEKPDEERSEGDH
jgi:hypothetical protein